MAAARHLLDTASVPYPTAVLPLVSMDNRLSATFSNKYKAAARIIIALTNTSDLSIRLGNLWIFTFTILIAGTNKLHKALSLALGRVVTSLPCVGVWLDALISLRQAHPAPIASLLCTGTTFVFGRNGHVSSAWLVATRGKKNKQETPEQNCILHGRISS
jgi:hypothetical protein